MQSLERATRLLREARTLEGLSALLRELGFPAQTLPLDASAQKALGLPQTLLAARITQGAGCLRALLVSVSDPTPLREAVSAVANALSTRSAQLLWIVIALRPATDEIALVCWAVDNRRCKVVSLVCDQNRIFESDAETLCALGAACSESDLLTHARWLDILGREAITRRFFRTLERVVANLGDSLYADNRRLRSKPSPSRITSPERKELSLLYVSRLIFLSFLESKGWLNGDFGFLHNGYMRCMTSGGKYQSRVLEPLFFGTLNTRMTSRAKRSREFGRIPYLNGGLFARSSLEKRCRGWSFGDDALGEAYGDLLSRYRFTGREDSSDWSDTAIDPEMLGKAFEALMVSSDRKASGAFYTPQSLVEDLTDRAFGSAVSTLGSLPVAPNATIEALRSLRILDPACGSGAFLVHALERLAGLRLAHGEDGSIAEVRRRVLTRSIFGVDVNPTAVWLCELRLWLSIVIESADQDPMRVMPLPNLDRNIRVGDSLGGGGFIEYAQRGGVQKVAELRNRYTRAVGPRKRTLARALDRYERNAAAESLTREVARLARDRRELLDNIRSRDLFGERHAPGPDAVRSLASMRLRIKEAKHRIAALKRGAALPFSFAAHFADVAGSGGFDIVLGNPPWVRVHRISSSSRLRLRREFEVYRTAPWAGGASASGAGHGFAAQVDLAALFVERSCTLLRTGGTLAFLLPAKLWRSLAGGGLRAHLLDKTEIVELEDLSDTAAQFDAAVYPSMLVCRRLGGIAPAGATSSKLAVRLRTETISWACDARSHAYDESRGSPWILLPPHARDAFDLLASAGAPLAASRFGRPLLGAKTGLNSAYIVNVERVDGDLASISSGERSGQIERSALRPLVRGETLDAWGLTGTREYIVWPGSARSRDELPPLVKRWLAPHRDQLARRTDLRGRLPWWSIFRRDGADPGRPRVIWADFGLAPRAIVVEAGDPVVALNSCYVAKCESLSDACALAALLNGPLAASWLNVLAEPARGGYHRYLGWTMGLLPIPRDWEAAREVLAPLGKRGMRGECVTGSDLLTAALEAYRLSVQDVEPLLTWTLASD